MKKKNKLLSLLILVMIAIPMLNFAQTAAPEEYKNAVDWAQGGNIFEDWFMKSFLQGWKAKVWSEYGTFIDMARALGGCLAIIYFAIKSYEMMTGDKRLEILPLLRPFGLCLIIINWKVFITIISFPTDLIASAMSSKQEIQQGKVNNLRYIRSQYQYAMIQELYEKSAETEIAGETVKKFWDDPAGAIGSKIKETAMSVVKPVLAMKEKFEIGFQLALTQALELLALWILRIAVYVIFAIQIIYTGILIMLGPFSVALSILPMFKDSLATWISRFISVNLYLAIAFIVMFVGGVLQEFAMMSEIKKYAEVVGQNGGIVDASKFMYLKLNGIMSFGVVIISFFISAITMFTVPSISTWIVSTSGASSAVSTMGRASQQIASKLRMLF